MATNLATEPHAPDAEIGERIHHLLWRRRLSQASFATHLGVTQSAMSKKLRGGRPWYAGELIIAAAFLGVSVGYLFGEETPGSDPLNGRPED